MVLLIQYDNASYVSVATFDTMQDHSHVIHHAKAAYKKVQNMFERYTVDKDTVRRLCALFWKKSLPASTVSGNGAVLRG